MYDIIFCSFPPYQLHSIYSAPAILKGAVESAGYKAKCIDFAMHFLKLCDNDTQLYSKLQNYFVYSNESLSELSEKEKKIFKGFHEYVINTLSSVDTKFIGLSVFSHYTHTLIFNILSKLKDRGLTDKVVLGGRGLTFPAVKGKLLSFSDEECIVNFHETLQKRGLAKHFILGDGVPAIVDFLNTQNNNDFAMPETFFPNYDDYNFDDYQWVFGQQSIDVTGSTGCVRDCDFCDIRAQFGKYKFKDGKEFAEELITLQQKYNINKFVLTDSLSNGGMKHFKLFVGRLAEYNSTAINPITWSGQYICREMMSYKGIDEYYKLLKLSGVQGLTIGMESGSNVVLEAMDKKTTVEALFFELEKFREHKITCNLLMIVGHWAETAEEFKNHARVLIRLAPYVRSGTISSVSLGLTYKLLPNTPAFSNINIARDPQEYLTLWVNRNNRSNTFKTRISRRITASLIGDILKFPALEDDEQLYMEFDSIRSLAKQSNEFFKKYSSDVESSFIDEPMEYVNDLLQEKNTIDIKLRVKANSCKTSPNLIIRVGNKELLNNVLANGEHEFIYSVPINEIGNLGRLSLAMTNKQDNETEVNESGEIIKDKSIVFQSLIIDNYDVMDDPEFFYSHFYVDNNGNREPASTGLWKNSELVLDFQLPFSLFYNNESKKGFSADYIKNRKDSTVRVQSDSDELRTMIMKYLKENIIL